MPEMHPQGHVPAEPVTPGRERRDADVRLVARVAVGLTLTAVVIHVVLWFVTVIAVEHAVVVAVPLALPTASPLPFPAPALQTDPRRDLAGMRQDETRILSTYEWVDPGAGIVRVPIDVAMAMLARRGANARPTSRPTPEVSAHAP